MEDNKDQVWTTPKSEIRREGNMFILKLKPDCEIDQEEAWKQVRTVYEKTGKEWFRMLVDITGARKMNREARKVYSSDETGRQVIAVAIVASSPVSRMIGNFFFGLNRLSFPARLFNSIEDAKKWLKKQQRPPAPAEPSD